MLTQLKRLTHLAAFAAIVFTPFTASAQEKDPQASWPTSIAIQTKTGEQIPAGAFGVVQINAPRVATLLQLRGVAGRGTALMRSADSHDCISLPIRFVAGDFGGESISVHTSKPIRLIIQTTKVFRALARGEDVVSDMYRVSSLTNDPKADIIIESGLSDSHGFVLNPGTSIAADLFGAKANRTACSEL